MAKYRFLGFLSEVDGRKLSLFGQKIELSLDAAREAIAGGCPIISEEQFETVGFSKEQIEKYTLPARHSEAPADFLAKKEKALEIFRAEREKETKWRKAELSERALKLRAFESPVKPKPAEMKLSPAKDPK